MNKRKKLTVYDYLKSKGKRQLSNLFVHTIEEAEIDYKASCFFPREVRSLTVALFL